MNNKQNAQKIILRNAGKAEDLAAVLRFAKDFASKDEDAKKDDKRTFEQSLLECVTNAESIALSIRDLAYSSIPNTKQVYESKNSVSTDIYKASVQVDENVLKVVIPMLCPHKDATPRRLLMLDPIMTAFKQFELKGNKLPRYTQAVIFFRNVINPHIYKNFPRDNDNYEYAKVQNAIINQVMADDDYMSCKLFVDTTFGKETSTEIYVIPTSEFGNWYQNNLPNLAK